MDELEKELKRLDEVLLKEEINGFRITRRIANGAFSGGYLAEKNDTDQIFVKAPVRESLILPFKKVANRYKKLGSIEGVVPYLGMEEFEGLPLLLFEYTKEPTLRRLLNKLSEKKNTFRPEQAIGIALNELEILKRLHSKGVVHGDNKPSNTHISKDLKVSLTDLFHEEIAGQKPRKQTSRYVKYGSLEVGFNDEYASELLKYKGILIPKEDLSFLVKKLSLMLTGRKGGIRAKNFSDPYKEQMGIVEDIYDLAILGNPRQEIIDDPDAFDIEERGYFFAEEMEKDLSKVYERLLEIRQKIDGVKTRIRKRMEKSIEKPKTPDYRPLKQVKARIFGLIDPTNNPDSFHETGLFIHPSEVWKAYAGFEKTARTYPNGDQYVSKQVQDTDKHILDGFVRPQNIACQEIYKKLYSIAEETIGGLRITINDQESKIEEIERKTNGLAELAINSIKEFRKGPKKFVEHEYALGVP